MKQQAMHIHSGVWSGARHALRSIAGALALLIAACGSDHHPPAVAPSVTSTTPSASASGIATTTSINAVFDQPMDQSTLTASTFTVACPAGTPVAGAVTYDSSTRSAIFTPTAALTGDATCSAALSTDVKDSQGLALSGAFTWTFNTATDPAVAAQGQQIFRYETFGDESKWTDALHMNDVITAAVDPTTALSVGLKVDAEALPAAVVQGIENGSISLTSPATTIALLKLNAVIGLKGTVESVNGVDTLTRVGITCALCHSSVDDSFAPGIGKRLDGWPNRDLNPGAIIALSPALGAATKAVFNSWGKGKYDPRFNLDGFNGPQVIPPAFGLKGLHSITSTGDGSDIEYWNRYVAVTQMGGHGTFSEPRTGVLVTNGTDDLVSDKLGPLQAYQISLAAPAPPAGSFDADAATRGQAIFNGAGQCSTCHTGSDFTDGNTTLHAPSEVVSEPEPNGAPSYASRSATTQYRTAPLKGLWQHAPYFHNGTAATLDDVVATYNTKKSLGLSSADMSDLVQYLKSL